LLPQKKKKKKLSIAGSGLAGVVYSHLFAAFAIENRSIVASRGPRVADSSFLKGRLPEFGFKVQLKVGLLLLAAPPQDTL